MNICDCFYLGISDYFLFPSLDKTARTLASYVAAGMAESNTMKAGFQAFGLGIVIFMIPLAFVMDPVLLWSGTLSQFLIAFVGMLCATLSWAIFIQGWLRFPITLLERALFLIICIGLVFSATMTVKWLLFLMLFCAVCAWSALLKGALFGVPSQHPAAAPPHKEG